MILRHFQAVSGVAEDEAPEEEQMKHQESTHNSPTSPNDPSDNGKQTQSQFTTEFMPTPVDEASVSLSKDGSSTFLFAMSTGNSLVPYSVSLKMLCYEHWSAAERHIIVNR